MNLHSQSQASKFKIWIYIAKVEHLNSNFEFRQYKPNTQIQILNLGTQKKTFKFKIWICKHKTKYLILHNKFFFPHYHRIFTFIFKIEAEITLMKAKSTIYYISFNLIQIYSGFGILWISDFFPYWLPKPSEDHYDQCALLCILLVGLCSSSCNLTPACHCASTFAPAAEKRACAGNGCSGRAVILFSLSSLWLW